MRWRYYLIVLGDAGRKLYEFDSARDRQQAVTIGLDANEGTHYIRFDVADGGEVTLHPTEEDE